MKEKNRKAPLPFLRQKQLYAFSDKSIWVQLLYLSLYQAALKTSVNAKISHWQNGFFHVHVEFWDMKANY